MKINKKILGLMLVLSLVLVMPLAAAQEGEHPENSVARIVHFLAIVLIVIMVVFTFKAAGMFAQDLGKAMKLIATGMIFLGINNLLEELHHFGIMLVPEGTAHSMLHHGAAGIGYLLLAYGFYRIYIVAKGVSGKSQPTK